MFICSANIQISRTNITIYMFSLQQDMVEFLRAGRFRNKIYTGFLQNWALPELNQFFSLYCNSWTTYIHLPMCLHFQLKIILGELGIQLINKKILYCKYYFTIYIPLSLESKNSWSVTDGESELHINYRVLTKDIINHKFRDQLFKQGQKLKFTHIFKCIWPYPLFSI